MMKLKISLLGGVLALSMLGLSAAQAQDAAKALGLFQSLLRAPQPAAAPVATPADARAGDLVQMLMQALDQIDEPREIEIGRQMSALLLGSKPLHADMNAQRYLNRLGRWISLQSSRPTLPWTFIVLDDAGFNAFAAPGGYVFVTRGLMERIRDESELAAILAHEITHVTERHHLRALHKSARAGLLAQFIGSRLSGGDRVASQLTALGRDLYTKGLDREDEFEADRNAVVLAARAGFDPYGLIVVLQQLRSAKADDSVFAFALSTHPPTQDRLDHIEQAMGQRLDAYAGKPGVSVAQRLRGAP